MKQFLVKILIDKLKIIIIIIGYTLNIILLTSQYHNKSWKILIISIFRKKLKQNYFVNVETYPRLY
jgi:hypothetical protein